MAVCRRILVIDNNPDAGAALCAFLETWGHSTTFAESGRQGVRHALKGSFDVIVVDLGLSDLNGYKVVQRIRSEPTGYVPVIIAYSDYHRREGIALQAGCDAFILTPSIDELEFLVGLSRTDVRQYAAFAGPATARRRG